MSIPDSVRAVISSGPKEWAIAVITSVCCLLLAAVLFVNALNARSAFEPLTVKSAPVLENTARVTSGDTQMLIAGEWCLNYSQVVVGFRSVYLITDFGSPVQLAVQPRLWRPGCEVVRQPYTIPASLPAGMYRLTGVDIAQAPDGRLQQTGWSTEPFKVPARAESQ